MHRYWRLLPRRRTTTIEHEGRTLTGTPTAVDADNADMEPDFDSDCVVHGVATWSVNGGHEVIHYCDDRCDRRCRLGGEETGQWCDGPLEMRANPLTSVS